MVDKAARHYSDRARRSHGLALFRNTGANVNRKSGTRVYVLLVHEVTKEEKKRWGTLDRDEGLWDYSDVRFDDNPNMVSPVLSYYLFTEQDERTTTN